MEAGAKIGILVTALAAALTCVVWFASDREPPAPASPGQPAADVPASADPPGRAGEITEPVPRIHIDKPRRRIGDVPAAPAARGDVRVVGRVVDEQGAPVAGADVRALRSGQPADETRSAADGRFTLRCGRRPDTGSAEIGLIATLGPARAAFQVTELLDDEPQEDDVGDLELGLAVPLTARIVDASGPVPGARVFLGSFFGTVFATATADAKGVARFETSPATDAWLFAYAPGHGRARGEIPDERNPKVPLVLTLTARTLRVSVVQMPAGVPLAGERISARLLTDADGSRLFSSLVPLLDLPPTGGTGMVEIDDLGADDTVELRRAPRDVSSEPWRAPPSTSGPGLVATAGPHEIEVRIDVPSGRELRWRILPGEGAGPQEGALVDLRRGRSGCLPSPSPLALKADGGFLVGADFGEGEVRAIARARDGSIARVGSSGEAVFVKPRRVDVLVRDPAGQPLAGVEVSLSGTTMGAVDEPVRTDDAGVASFGGLEPDLGVLDVSVRTESPPEPQWVASVDPAKGDARLDIRLARTRDFVVRVTTDGERKLPPQWRLFVERTWRQDASADGEGNIRVAAREPTAGQPLHLVLRCTGFDDAAAGVVCDEGEGPVTADLALVRGVTIWAEFRPSALESVRGRTNPPTVQRWSDDARAWIDSTDRPSLGMRRPEPDGRWRLDSMPPGRYRLAASYSGATSDPVDVTSAGQQGSLVLDLSRSGTVRVRVVGPDDKAAESPWVEVQRVGAGDSPPLVIAATAIGRVEGGLIFAPLDVPVPGDRPVRITARSALLRPDPEHGSAEVTQPGGDLVLRLVEGPVISFATASSGPGLVQQDLGNGGHPFGGEWSFIQMFRGLPGSQPSVVLSPVVVDGRFRAGGFDPGRYTLWIRLEHGAPIVLPDLDLHDGLNELGELRAPRGSSVRVRLSVPEGQAAPRYSLIATRLDPPRYRVYGGSNGGSEIVLTGLGPGRFEVVARPPARPLETTLRRIVDADGEHDIVIDSSTR